MRSNSTRPPALAARLRSAACFPYGPSAPIATRRLATLLAVALMTAPAIGFASTSTYTLDADFAQGSLLNVNYAGPNGDQLQLNATTTPFPFINIAASQRGTVVRINTVTGEVVGEYRTAPAGRGANPSRTTVDQLGNAWVGNRDESSISPDGSGIFRGSATRIGLVIGGTRVDADGQPDAAGQYLAAPFEYNTCVDRDGDGLIRTSRGQLDILAWSNSGGADSHGGVGTALDECVIDFVRAGGGATRAVSIDSNNDVWIGGAFGGDSHAFERVDGVSGQRVDDTRFNLGCGGYGAVVDRTGVLWGASSGGTFLRYDTTTDIGVCLGGISGNYGVAASPTTGEIWFSELFGTLRLYRVDPATGTVADSYLQGISAQGLAVDGNGHVWVAELFGSRIAHFAPDPGLAGNYLLVGYVPGFNGTTGVAVDADGKIWASEINANRVSRIDPAAGSLGAGGIAVGEIDLQVSLGAGAGPYNYSDMTGFVAIGATAPLGSWTVVKDGGEAGTPWSRILWNAEPQGGVPDGASLVVSARAADAQAGLSGVAFDEVGNGDALALDGRFIEVRVEFRANADGASPVLSDLSIVSGGEDLVLGLDIRPQSCPNPINQRARGVLPVAILGSGAFDVRDIEPGSIRLEGVAALRHAFEDVATPYDAGQGFISARDCHTLGADGHLDMTLKFDNQSIVAAIGQWNPGEVLVLQLTGQLQDGTPFTASDVVLVVR